MAKVKFKYRSVEELVAYDKNPMIHPEPQIAELAQGIKTYGFNYPVVLDASNMIIAGHGRLQAAMRLGMKEVPTVSVEHLTAEQVRAFRIFDNKISRKSTFDMELLRGEIIDLGSIGFDLEATGFTEMELDGLMVGELSDILPDSPSTIEVAGYTRKVRNEGLTDADEVPDEPVRAVSQLGDVWTLGAHRLMCGDATSEQDVAVLIAGVSADLWITDPPYNVAYVGKTSDALTIQNDSMSDDDFRDFLKKSYTAADSNMRPGAVFYIWHADSEGFNFRGAARDIGWRVRQCLIWNKNSLVLGRQDYHWKHEPCLYGWKEGAGHLWNSDRSQTTVLNFNRPSRSSEHPTMKPVELFEYKIENSTVDGNVVLDTFGGSGTTLIACEKLDRCARLMELDPKYVDVIVNRWQNFTGLSAVHADTGMSFDQMAEQRRK